jgi:ankyrin repeat protein
MTTNKTTDITGVIIRVIAIGLLIAFFFPVIVLEDGTIRAAILNIEVFFSAYFGGGKIPPMILVQLIYPLIAGFFLFKVARWKPGLGKGLTLSLTGLFPFLLILSNDKFQEGFGQVTGRASHGGLSTGLIVLLLAAATFLILAGAYAVRLNPGNKTAGFAAALGGAIYIAYLIYTFVGQYIFIQPYAPAPPPPTARTGAPGFTLFGFFILFNLALMLVIAAHCFLLTRKNTQKERMGKRIILLWFIQPFLVFAIIVHSLQSFSWGRGMAGFGFFVMAITAIIKITPWVLGLFLLVPLGLAELLVPRIGIINFLKKIFSTIFKKLALIPLRVWLIPVIVILIVFLSAVTYENTRPDPKATKALFYAASKGDMAAVERLIEKRADINAPFRYNSTPLLEALKNGHAKVGRFLIEKGAEVNVSDQFGRTPLFAAAVRGKTEIVRLLLAKGADVDPKQEKALNPLKTASERGNMEIVRILIDKGADIEWRDSYGRSSLYTAISMNRPRVARFLIDKGASVNSADKHGVTVLHKAVGNSQLEIVEALIDKGAGVNPKTVGGAMPIHVAVRVGDIPVVRLLINKGAKIDQRGEYGLYPLHIAAEMGHLDVVRLLLEKGAPVDSRDSYRNTALHFAARVDKNKKKPPAGMKKCPLVQMLIDHGARIDPVDKAGNTPLHEAVSRGTLAKVRTLVENGADINAENRRGETPGDRSKAFSNPASSRYKEVKQIVDYLNSQKAR